MVMKMKNVSTRSLAQQEKQQTERIIFLLTLKSIMTSYINNVMIAFVNL